MKHILLFTIVFITLAMPVQAQKTVKLFNGEDLSGWMAFIRDEGRTKDADKVFDVKDGVIKMSGDRVGYMMTKKCYSNFVLTLEYRWNIDDKSVAPTQTKNSGVMYHVPKKAADEIFPCGIQFQVKEGNTGDFIFLRESKLTIKGTEIEAGNSVVSPKFTEAEKKAGEWNTIEITSNNGTITQKLNGVIVNEGTNSSVTKGRILLAYEKYPIDFKDIVLIKK